ncbi:MAG: phosphate signaling complex protein PhoU [Hyphomonadaceae bacterium]|nr:phosphate signaling complex protein PhoU [Clostridia bacterium]
MTRNSFDTELDALHFEVVEMAAHTEKAIEQAIVALKNNDMLLAQKIIDGDDLLDDFEKDIEQKCVHIIATKQPVAKDLRLVTAILKMITDLERMADHASDICEIMLSLSKESPIQIPEEIPLMASIASEMVRNAINAYVHKDIALAHHVIERDKEINRYFYAAVAHIQDIMRQDVQMITQATNVIFIAKYIERIGDHATNVAEWAIFNITGIHE